MLTASTKKKIKSLLPSFLIGQINNIVVKNKLRLRKQAYAWYGNIAVTTEEAIKIITGKESYSSFFDMHGDVYAQAKQAAEACPVKMGGPGGLELIYQISEHLGAVRVVETGVAYGWSSLAFGASLHNRPDALLISTDRPYPDKDNQAYVGVVMPESYKKQWKLLFGLDVDILPDALASVSPIDMCHYDSDKRYEGRMRAYQQLWDALRPGGVFLSDDIGDNFAFRDFAKKIGVDPIVAQKHIPHKEGMFVGILCKPE